jgi:hypothetical protein
MRRWKVINDDGHFNLDDVLVLHENDGTSLPYFKRLGESQWCDTYLWRLVEIDENGNTIRTYKKGDTLNGGTIVDKRQQALERLTALESEAKALREIIEAPDKVAFDFTNGVFVAYTDNVNYILLGDPIAEEYFWFSLHNSGNRKCNAKCGQEAIDHVLEQGYAVIKFNTKKEALEFMLSKEK